jgi:hypothetical protein
MKEKESFPHQGEDGGNWEKLKEIRNIPEQMFLRFLQNEIYLNLWKRNIPEP